MCTCAIRAQINSNSSYLNAAAQAYENAAAQCQNPTGAACLRQYANYERCQANGGSCGNAPTCSTSCVSTGTGGMGTTALTPGMTAAQNKVQQMDNLVNAGISLFEMFHKSQPDSQPPADNSPAPDPAAEAAAAAAAQQQLINAQAAQLLADANADLPSYSATPAPAQPDPNATLDNLLDNNSQPADTSTSLIANLLDGGSSQTDSGLAPDTSPVAPDATTTLSNLLTPDNSATESGTATNTVPQTFPNQSIPADVIPSDPATETAFGDSIDQPDQDQSQSLGQMLQSSVVQPLQDGLSSLVSTGKSLISDTLNSPVVQWLASDQASLTTIPLSPSGTDPDTAANAVFAQSIVGMGGIAKGMATGEYSAVARATGVSTILEGMGVGPTAFATSSAIYNYGTKLVDQFGAQLGLASASPDQDNSQ